MALPDFQSYYWACNIRPMLHWLYEDPSADAHSWLAIESKSFKQSSLAALLYAPLSSSYTAHTTNLLVKPSLKIWTQIRWHFGWQTFSLKSPVYANYYFKPSLMDKALCGTMRVSSNLQIYITMELSSPSNICVITLIFLELIFFVFSKSVTSLGIFLLYLQANLLAPHMTID